MTTATLDRTVEHHIYADQDTPMVCTYQRTWCGQHMTCIMIDCDGEHHVMCSCDQ